MKANNELKINKGLIYGSAITIAIAGILHLAMVPSVLKFNVNSAIFFGVVGALQLFWILPMIRQYSNVWYYIGIIGNIILIALWGITRFNNPITGRAGPINELGIAVEIFQVAYVILASIILAKRRASVKKEEEKEVKKN